MQKNSVILLFFDLPSTVSEERRRYRKFIKYIKENGFVRFQESVYIKLLRNEKSYIFEVEKLLKNLPPEGEISVLPLTMNEISKLRHVLGDGFDLGFFSDDIILLKTLDNCENLIYNDTYLNCTLCS